MISIDRFEPWLTRWQLAADGQALTTRFGNHLLPVLHQGSQAMLKIAVHDEERRGGALMEWWDGAGAARVLARDGDALLMVRLSCARSLAAMARTGRDDEATRILCQTAQALHRPRRRPPPPPTLVPLPVWFQALDSAAAQYGGTFEKSAVTAKALLQAPRDPVVLHGDFHHDNVLDGQDQGWLVIDPKGLIGEAGFEYANLFRNPDASIALAPDQLRQRAEIVIEETGQEMDRVLQWVVAYAGLGAAWSLSSGHDPQPGLDIAEAAARELAR